MAKECIDRVTLSTSTIGLMALVLAVVGGSIKILDRLYLHTDETTPAHVLHSVEQNAIVIRSINTALSHMISSQELQLRTEQLRHVAVMRELDHLSDRLNGKNQ